MQPPIPPITPEASTSARARLTRLKSLIAVALTASVELKTQQLRMLATRSQYWVAFILAGSVWVYWMAARGHQLDSKPLFFDSSWQMTLPAWFAAVWLLAAPVLTLSVWTTRWLNRPRTRTQMQLATVAWVMATTFFAVAWSSGVYGLADFTPNGEFVLSNRTFLWITALGHVMTVVLLTANWMVVLSVLALGCLLPGRYFFDHVGGPGTAASIDWLTGELVAFLLIALMLHVDQKRVLLKQLTLDRLAEQRGSLLRAVEAQKQSLEEAKRRADNLAAQKGRLLDSFSHDLMQPLSALDFQLEEVKRLTLANPKVTEVLEDASVQRNSMLAMIEAARDLADAEAGEYPCAPREVSLQILLQDVISSHRHAAHQTGTRLSLFAPPLLVRTDKAILERIIGNLVSNAIKYTKGRADAHILVGCRRRGDLVRISVLDNGLGIPKDRQDDIFEEYVQLGNDERDRRKGIGLGLAIVRAFARMLDARISVQSEEDKGSAFTIEIPYVARVPLEYQGVPSTSAARQIDLREMKVLFVEDEPWQREAFARLVTSWGGAVLAASSWGDLCAKLKTRPDWDEPDILVTDYRLRRENGQDVIAASRGRWPSLPAVIWSANSPSAISRALTEAQVTVLSKGRIQDLVDVLCKHSTQTATSREGSQAIAPPA